MDGPATLSPGAIEHSRETLRLSQVVAIFRRSLGLILFCAVLAAAAAYVFAKSSPSRYTASASIAIEGQTFAIPELQGAVSNDSVTDPMPLIRTEVQAIVSRNIVQSVVAKLQLDRLPEFNPALRPPTIVKLLLRRLQRAIPVLRADAPPGSGRDDDIMDSVLRALVVSQDNRSLVIGVAFTSEDPVLSASFVNDLVGSYVASRTLRRAGANRDANAEMLQRVEDVRIGLNKLQQQMRELRTKDEVVGLRAGSIGQQQVEELATAAARASLERAELEAQWQRAQILVQQGLSSELTSVLSSTTITRLREQESEASRRLADLQSRFGPNYPAIQSAQANVDAARGQVNAEARRIVAALAGQVAVARAHEADTQRQLQAARNLSVKSENAQAQLNDLQEEVNAQRALYQSLLQGAQKTVAQATRTTPTLEVRVLSSAVPPARPSSPKPKLAVAMGGAAGFVLGFLLAFIRTHAADAVSSPEDLRDAAGFSVAATIRCSNARSLLARVRGDPESREADALRHLRSRVAAAGQQFAPRTVMFVSFHDAQEAAAGAAAFAYVMGSDHEKTILIDGNLREPSLGQLLGVHQGELLRVLEGQTSWHDVLLSDPAAHVDFLVNQRPAAAPKLLICGTHFQNLLTDLRDSYHLTIISGGLALGPDTHALARLVDVIVMIVQAGNASRTAIREACSQITAVSGSSPVLVLIGAA